MESGQLQLRHILGKLIHMCVNGFNCTKRTESTNSYFNRFVLFSISSVDIVFLVPTAFACKENNRNPSVNLARNLLHLSKMKQE